MRNSTLNLWRRIHRDQQGSMSLVSMFALLMLVFLLGMVMNTGRQVDQKVKMQNAADAIAWSGGLVMTRSMNTLAYTNHLLSDTFALTAFLREARDRNAASYVINILEHWARIGPFLATSPFPPFAELGEAIQEKVPRELEMAARFSDWGSAASEMMLPVLEEILAKEQIPEFQRALTMATPALSQAAAEEAAHRHGNAWPRKTLVHGVLWRTMVDPLNGAAEPTRRSLPVVDPTPHLDEGFTFAIDQEDYVVESRKQRSQLAHNYLRDWNNQALLAFDHYGKMSQFANLWRIFTCGYLKHLLEVEYPSTNLPFQLRHAGDPPGSQQDYIERDFMFVGVAYRTKPREMIPGVFRGGSTYDRQAFAQVSMFVPRRRLIRVLVGPGSSSAQGEAVGGVPGDFLTLPPDPAPPPPPPPSDEPPHWTVVRQGGGWDPDHWNLLTQNWHLQLVPATSRYTREILSTPVSITEITGETVTINNLPNWASLSPADFHNLNHH